MLHDRKSDYLGVGAQFIEVLDFFFIFIFLKCFVQDVHMGELWVHACLSSSPPSLVNKLHAECSFCMYKTLH